MDPSACWNVKYRVLVYYENLSQQFQVKVFSQGGHEALFTDRVSIAEFRNAVISASDYMGTLKQCGAMNLFW